MKMFNWLNHRYTPHSGEVFTKPSLTQPDEVLSIKEMLQRHVSGMYVPHKDGSYEEDLSELEFENEDLDAPFNFIPDYNALDLAERFDLAQDLALRAQELMDLERNPPPPPSDDEAPTDDPTP